MNSPVWVAVFIKVFLCTALHLKPNERTTSMTAAVSEISRSPARGLHSSGLDSTRAPTSKNITSLFYIWLNPFLLLMLLQQTLRFRKWGENSRPAIYSTVKCWQMYLLDIIPSIHSSVLVLDGQPCWLQYIRRKWEKVIRHVDILCVFCMSRFLNETQYSTTLNFPKHWWGQNVNLTLNQEWDPDLYLSKLS